MSNGDLISRKALVKAILEERDKIPLTITERYAFGCESPNKHGQSMRGGIHKALRCIEQAPAVDAVELPCKIGDTVWCIRNFHGHKHAQEGIVSEMLFTKAMKLQIVVKYVGRGHWGEKIFPTREAAESAINKKEKENEVPKHE